MKSSRVETILKEKKDRIAVVARVSVPGEMMAGSGWIRLDPGSAAINCTLLYCIEGGPHHFTLYFTVYGRILPGEISFS